MENDETMEQDFTPEETQIEDEPIKDVMDSTPTVEDYQRVVKENKTLKAQKEHWRKKATVEKTETKETNKPNETVDLTREEVVLLAKGVDERVLDEAKVIAQVKGIPLKEALEYPTVKAFSEHLASEQKRTKAQLGASKGSGAGGEVDLVNAVGMSREEHRKAIGM